MGYFSDEPEDPGPDAPFEHQERYRRARERWAMKRGGSLTTINRKHKSFMDMHSPVKAALWLALLRPTDELMERALDPNNEEEVPAIVSMAEAAVRKAIAGDMTAFNSIADRVEGRVGVRKGDLDPELENRAAEIAGTIEGIVGALVNAKLDGALDIEGEVEVIETPPSRRPNGTMASNGAHDPRVEREE